MRGDWYALSMRYVVTKFGPWRVNHDAAGKIVVRSAGQTKEVVIATAKWNGNSSVDRLQTDLTRPSDESWTGIDEAVRVALAAAAQSPPDPRLDGGVLPGPPANAPEKTTPMSTIRAFATLLVLAVLGVGLYFALDRLGVLELLRGSGSENGAACTRDSDCRSDNCHQKRCEANERPRGDRCTRDSDCRSNKCTLKICD